MNPTLTGHPQGKLWRGYESKNEKVGTIEDLDCVRGDDGALWSRWMPTRKERFAMILGSPVWLRVITERQPPVSVLAQFWPFGEAVPVHRVNVIKRMLRLAVVRLVG